MSLGFAIAQTIITLPGKYRIFGRHVANVTMSHRMQHPGPGFLSRRRDRRPPGFAGPENLPAVSPGWPRGPRGATVEPIMALSRRSFLALGAAAGASFMTGRAEAIGPGSKFRFGQLQLGESWNPRPTAVRRMGWEVSKRTSIDVDLEARVVSAGQTRIFTRRHFSTWPATARSTCRPSARCRPCGAFSPTAAFS